MPRNWFAVALICALSCAGCSTPGLSIGHESAEAGGSRTEVALREMLQAPQRQFRQLGPQLTSFYASRNFRPAWIGSAEARARAASVVFALQHADRQGLRAADYPVDSDRGNARPQPGHDAALYDLTVTASLLRYAQDVRLGRVNPAAAYNDVELPVESFDAATTLESALEDDRIDSFLAGLPPQYPQYRALAGALARYRAIAAKGGWPRLTPKTATGLRLAKRLALEDPNLAKIAHPSAAVIKEALERFQARHGMKADGVLGGETLKALNVPVTYRIAEIAANMERWRWLPRHLEKRHITVDVPDQSVEFVDGGKRLLYSKVIIGEDNDNRTPILRTIASAIVVNPPWDIPDDIAAQALLPHLRKDPNYLATRNMVLVDGPKDDPQGRLIDWRKVKGDNLPYQIREQPGPHNVLGALMLDMPNDFDVYIHGTSNDATFNLSDREISHGCVRVQHVVKLATLVLDGSIADPRATLEHDIAGGGTERVPLAKPIPVYLLYWTASVRKDGTVEFRPDRYRRDPPLIARLSAPLVREVDKDGQRNRS